MSSITFAQAGEIKKQINQILVDNGLENYSLVNFEIGINDVPRDGGRCRVEERPDGSIVIIC